MNACRGLVVIIKSKNIHVTGTTISVLHDFMMINTNIMNPLVH